MAEILDIIDTKGEQVDQLESIRKNFLTLTKQGQKAGSYLLADIVGVTTQPISSTAFVPLTDFQGSFNSSGGLVLVDFSVLKDATGIDVFFALFIDDIAVGWAYSYETSGSLLHTVVISRWMQLNAGNHKFQVKCKVGSGSVTVGPQSTGTNGTLSVVEFLRG